MRPLHSRNGLLQNDQTARIVQFSKLLSFYVIGGGGGCTPVTVNETL
jgi:hypothetical protein